MRQAKRPQQHQSRCFTAGHGLLTAELGEGLPAPVLHCPPAQQLPHTRRRHSNNRLRISGWFVGVCRIRPVSLTVWGLF